MFNFYSNKFSSLQVKRTSLTHYIITFLKPECLIVRQDVIFLVTDENRCYNNNLAQSGGKKVGERLLIYHKTVNSYNFMHFCLFGLKGLYLICIVNVLNMKLLVD